MEAVGARKGERRGPEVGQEVRPAAIRDMGSRLQGLQFCVCLDLTCPFSGKDSGTSPPWRGRRVKEGRARGEPQRETEPGASCQDSRLWPFRQKDLSPAALPTAWGLAGGAETPPFTHPRVLPASEPATQQTPGTLVPNSTQPSGSARRRLALTLGLSVLRKIATTRS